MRSCFHSNSVALRPSDHIGIQFNASTASGEVDKSAWSFWTESFHTTQECFRLSGEEARKVGCIKAREVAALFDKSGWRTVSFLFSAIWARLWVPIVAGDYDIGICVGVPSGPATARLAASPRRRFIVADQKT